MKGLVEQCKGKDARTTHGSRVLKAIAADICPLTGKSWPTLAGEGGTKSGPAQNTSSSSHSHVANPVNTIIPEADIDLQVTYSDSDMDIEVQESPDPDTGEGLNIQTSASSTGAGDSHGNLKSEEELYILNLRELSELEDMGEKVSWPIGVTPPRCQSHY